jgi:hypothetical protein
MSRFLRKILPVGWLHQPGYYAGFRCLTALLGLLAGGLAGCETQPATQAVTAGPVAASPASAKAEPADNSYCYVCHVNYQEELLVTQHQAAGVGCERCHGTSAKHSADEDNLTAPERMYAAAKVAPFCLTCHAGEKLRQNANHQPVFAGATPQRCTECHGEHQMKNRTRRWDKDTGKLIWKDGGPGMDLKK